jgi:beta-fructofuranosidase
LSLPGDFGHLEVPQVEVVDGHPVLVFSVGADDVSWERRRRGPVSTTTYVCAAPSRLGPFDPSLAQALDVPSSLYSGRLVQHSDGSWAVIGFLNLDGDGRFIGEVTDPIPFRGPSS